MGTRALIKIEGHKVAVYKHFDGYPEATLPWLEAFNADFSERRKNDPDYKLAQLLRSSARDAEKYGLDDSKYTGWGVAMAHDDSIGQSYEYTLMNDGSVVVHKVL